MLELTRSPDFYKRQQRKTHKRLCVGVRFGLRYAALIRVIENPMPFVKRLARRIARAPKLLAKLSMRPDPAGTYLDVLFRETRQLSPAIPNSS